MDEKFSCWLVRAHITLCWIACICLFVCLLKVSARVVDAAAQRRFVAQGSNSHSDGSVNSVGVDCVFNASAVFANIIVAYVSGLTHIAIF